MGRALSKAYLLTKVLTASKHEVVVYLYEGAIGYLHRAVTMLREGNRPEAAHMVDRAVSIVIELSGTLNYAAGGQLAMRLDTIYNYLIESLTQAAGRADIEAIEACEGIMVVLHDAWQQAVSLSRSAEEAPAAAAQLRISA